MLNVLSDARLFERLRLEGSTAASSGLLKYHAGDLVLWRHRPGLHCPLAGAACQGEHVGKVTRFMRDEAGHHVALAGAFAGAGHLWDTQRAFPCLVPLDDIVCALPYIALDDERVRVLKPFEGDAAPQDGM